MKKSAKTTKIFKRPTHQALIFKDYRILKLLISSVKKQFPFLEVGSVPH